MWRTAIWTSLVFPAVSFAPQSLRLRSSNTKLYASALIVQNKGGGHGELGYHLAKTLEKNEKIDSITILQDDACSLAKEPFKSYALDLPNVNVVMAPLGDETMTKDRLQDILNGASFDYIFDNASKGPTGAGKACVDCAKDWNPKLYVYVSSAGMYQPTGVFPMPETTPVKESAGQNQFDLYVVAQGLPLVSFRPQYIYGPKANKFDYMYVQICGGCLFFLCVCVWLGLPFSLTVLLLTATTILIVLFEAFPFPFLEMARKWFR